MAIYGVRAVVGAISRKTYEMDGCPECGCKRCYEIVHTGDMVMLKCTNLECYVAFPVLEEIPSPTRGVSVP